MADPIEEITAAAKKAAKSLMARVESDLEDIDGALRLLIHDFDLEGMLAKECGENVARAFIAGEILGILHKAIKETK